MDPKINIERTCLYMKVIGRRAHNLSTSINLTINMMGGRGNVCDRLTSVRIFALISNEKFIHDPKTTRKETTASIWIDTHVTLVGCFIPRGSGLALK